MKQGLFFVIEGTDGSGKATQVKLLEDALSNLGYDVLHQEFPRYDHPASFVTRQYLEKKYGKKSSKMATLFYAVDRIDADILEIKPHLNKPNSVCVSDRWVSSNKGHQGGKAKTHEEFLETINYINFIEYEVGELSKPTQIIYLKQDPILGQRLSGIGKNKNFQGKDLHEEDIDHLYDSANAYMNVAKLENWSIIDVINTEINKNDRELMAKEKPAKLMNSPQEIHKEIMQVIQQYL